MRSCPPAYAEDKDCGHKAKINDTVRTKLLGMLGNVSDSTHGWERVNAIEKAGDCEDERGLYYNVWKRESPGGVDVVIAYRGTWGIKDWTHGNLHWFTRFFMDDQYPRAVEDADAVIRYFNNGEGKPAPGRKSLRFYTTGHSLGGGRAQHVLYARPKEILQAFAFDPSSVTGFVDVPQESQIAGCSCVRSLGAEARIYRFYESYEVLTHLRFVHKLFFAPNRHIQEVRFGFSSSPNP